MNIYFCQSSTDLLKILYLTKINKNNNCLICVNVNGCYDLALNLNNKFNIFDKCLLIKSKLDNPYNLFNWFSEYFNIIKIKNQLNKSSSSKIYFFSEYFDLLTFSVIKKIKNPIDIYVENNPETNKFIEIQNSFKSKLMSFLYGIKVSNYDYKGLKVFGINKSFYKKVFKKNSINHFF